MKVIPITDGIAWKSTKTQKWNTSVKEFGSGKERTLTRWAYPKWEIDTHFALLTPEGADSLFGFFASLKGAYEPFLWLDPEHNKVKDIQIGTGDNVTASFQAIKKFGGYVEPTKDVKADTLEVKVNGVKVKSSVKDGLITLETIPKQGEKITASYTYYWRVRLSDDSFGIEVLFKDIWKSKSMKLVSVR